MADPRAPLGQANANTEVLKQIQAAWDEAQAQLTILREQVEHATSMATAKVQSNVLERDLDRAYRELGEAVWAEVSKGKFKLPNNITTVQKALGQVTERIQAQNASINDLLAEGAEIAVRLQKKMQSAVKGVALGPKKK